MKTRIRNDRHSKRGVSLIELAIVLGVVGIITGGVWMVAVQANAKAEQQTFSNLLLTTLNSVRGVYSSQAYVDTTDATVLTPKLVSMKTLSSTTVNPFGYMPHPRWAAAPQTFLTMYVCGWAATGSNECNPSSISTNVPLFAIETLVPAGQNCIDAVMANSGSTLLPGLVDISINGGLSSGGATAVGSGQSLPVTLAWAKANCVAFNNTSTAAVISFVFRPNP